MDTFMDYTNILRNRRYYKLLYFSNGNLYDSSLFSLILESALVIKKTDFPMSMMMCNIKIKIVFKTEKIINLQLIHISVRPSIENSNKRGIVRMRQDINIINANLSSACVTSNAYLLFFANSNNLFVINEYIANNNAVKEISKVKKLDL